MSIRYFENFPRINYFNVVAPNITLRTAFLEKLKLEATVYFPYSVEDGETADAIASWYYGKPDYDWLIYMANDIIDPHTQWPKSSLQFEDYITKKYGSAITARSTILFYRRNPDVSYISVDGADFSTTANSNMNIVLSNTDLRITVDSYAAVADPLNYYAVYAYDYELELNDNKRNINLIDNKLKGLVSTELGNLLNV
jgi:hypothetical protein